MNRRWLFGLFALSLWGEDRVSKQRAVELAADWARRNRGGLDRCKTPLRFEKARAEASTWKNDRGESRPVWFVYFPEQETQVEPSGLAVRVDRETGEIRQAILE